MLRKIFELDQIDKLIRIITIINDFKSDKLLDKFEITVLAHLYSLPKEHDKKMFSAGSRKSIVNTIKENYYPKCSVVSYNNTLYKLRDKGFIRMDTDKVMYLTDRYEFLRDLKNKEFKMELVFK